MPTFTFAHLIVLTSLCEQEDCEYSPRQHVASPADKGKGGVKPSDGVGSSAAAAVLAAAHGVSTCTAPGESQLIDFDPFEDAVAAATPAHVSYPQILLHTACGGADHAREAAGVGTGNDKSGVGTCIIDDLLGLVSCFLHTTRAVSLFPPLEQEGFLLDKAGPDHACVACFSTDARGLSRPDHPCVACARAGSYHSSTTHP